MFTMGWQVESIAAKAVEKVVPLCVAEQFRLTGPLQERVFERHVKCRKCDRLAREAEAEPIERGVLVTGPTEWDVVLSPMPTNDELDALNRPWTLEGDQPIGRMEIRLTDPALLDTFQPGRWMRFEVVQPRGSR